MSSDDVDYNLYIIQGNMVPVLQCLKALKASFSSNGGVDRGQIHQRKRWNPLEADVTGESDCSQGNMLSCIEPFISGIIIIVNICVSTLGKRTYTKFLLPYRII